MITLFHKPASTTSIQALRLLKRVSAAASGAVTGVAEDDDVKYKVRREEFELNVTEDPPTTDQLRNILEYVGARRAGDLVTGARDEAEAMRKLKENGENFQRPVVSSPGRKRRGTSTEDVHP